ncbi:MAG: Gldg family protein [Verrucomicrobiota bacterium JB023]|nr:Gldg family protein [Verrucomicrobiota bacterium JB023]
MKQSNNPTLNAILGIAALLAIAFFANWLMAISSAGNKTLDLTESKVHTLTEGTKSILEDVKEADAEVVINYYATRDTDFMPQQLKLYMKKVDDFLKAYKAIAGDNLRIVNLDPKPDTDAEDSANLDGIAGQQINGENLYLGLSVQSLDQKASIPYLDPSGEPQLEYEISSRIAQVTRTDRPRLGIMSALPLAGSPAQMPGQQPTRPSLFYQQLQQFYEVEDLSMTPTAAQLEDLTAVLLVHPAGITPETEFLLDQYLLEGGTIVAALDSFSFIASQTAGGNPMMGMTGTPTTSTFSNELLKSWGVSFISDQTLADGKYRTRLAQGDSTSILSLTKEAVPDNGSIITENINELFIVFPGAFTLQGGEGLKLTSLIRSSKQSGFVDSFRAARFDPTLLTSVRTDDKMYDLAVHVKGTFKTAYPEGNPADAEENAEEGSVAAEAAEAESEETAEDFLKESTSPGNVFLIADSDFLADQFAFNPQLLRQGLVLPQGDNLAFLFNLLDQVTGSKHLIGSRSRGDSRRPFTVVQEMDAEFEKEFGEKLQKEQAELDETNKRINELVRQQQEQGRLAATPELQAEIASAREKQVEARGRLRELEKDLRKQKDALAAGYTKLNIFLMPSLVALIGIAVFIKRRFSTSAR